MKRIFVCVFHSNTHTILIPSHPIRIAWLRRMNEWMNELNLIHQSGNPLHTKNENVRDTMGSLMVAVECCCWVREASWKIIHHHHLEALYVSLSIPVRPPFHVIRWPWNGRMSLPLGITGLREKGSSKKIKNSMLPMFCKDEIHWAMMQWWWCPPHPGGRWSIARKIG